MSCGCDKTIQVPVSTCCNSPVDESVQPINEWLKDKFYDKTIGSFTIPAVGKTTILPVNNPSRFIAGQFLGIIIGKSKYAFLKIVEVNQTTLKLLNGCEKDNQTASIYGNPTPGVSYEEGLIIFPAPPTGCSSQLQQDFASLIATYGEEAVLKIFNEADEIRLFSTPELNDDESAFLFGGTQEDCDCAPTDPGLVTSFLRKIRNIFTGQSGKTLCMPEVSQIDEADVVVGDTTKYKYLAYFDQNGCLKKGAKAKEIASGAHAIFPKFVTLYDGNTSTITVNTTTLGIPKQIGSRQRYAVFEIWLQVTGTPGSQIDGRINGTQCLKAYVGVSGGADEGTRHVEVAVTDNQNITLQGVITGGTPTVARTVIRLLHFLA